MTARLQLRNAFPQLEGTFQITSPATEEYNCICWAAGESDAWWWPDPDSYWPPDVARVETEAAFVDAFSKRGYSISMNEAHDPRKEKLALYLKDGRPTHMARQLEDGTWTSKLGQSFDIQHATASSISGDSYGESTIFFERVL